MELINEFKVPVPIEKAWEVLTDLKLIAPCLPGAELDRVKNGEYEGTIKVKVGPIVTSYAGVATWVDRNHKTYTAILKADGKESKGTGSAAAVVHATLKPIIVDDNSITRVTVTTNLSISGKVAQLGRGLLDDVSGKILDIFASNLSNLLNGQPIESVMNGSEGTAELGSDHLNEGANEQEANIQNKIFDIDSDAVEGKVEEPNLELSHEEEKGLPIENIEGQDGIVVEDNSDPSGDLLLGLNFSSEEIELADDNLPMATGTSDDNPDQNLELTDSLKERLEDIRRDIDEARQAASQNANLEQSRIGKVTADNDDDDNNLISSVPSESNDEIKSDEDVAEDQEYKQNSEATSDESALGIVNPIVADKLSKLATEIDLDDEIDEVNSRTQGSNADRVDIEGSPADEKLSKLSNSIETELDEGEGSLGEIAIGNFTAEEIDTEVEELDDINAVEALLADDEDITLYDQEDIQDSEPGMSSVDSGDRADDKVDFFESDLPIDENPENVPEENIVELQIPQGDLLTDGSLQGSNGEVIPIFKSSNANEQLNSPEAFVTTEDSKEENGESGLQNLASIIEMPQTSVNSTESVKTGEEANGRDLETHSASSVDELKIESQPNEPIDILDLVSSPLKSRLKPIIIPSVGVILLLIIRRILKTKSP